MKKRISIALVLTFVIGLVPAVAKARLVACVGDSVTYGFGLTNRASDSYPAQLATILRSFDNGWETQNFGVSGATLLRNTNRPYVLQNAYQSALASEPDVVVIELGGNDTARATILQIEQNFISDYLALIDSFAQLPSQPRIFVCKQPPVFGGNYGSNTTLRDVIFPLIEQLPAHRAVEVIDIHTPMEEFGHLFPDYLHPNAEGAGMLAEIVASVILGFRFLPDFNGDGKIDMEDLITLIDHWGKNEPALDVAPAPLGDGMVDRADLEVLMTFWEEEINDPTLIAHWPLDEAAGGTAHNSVAGNDDFVIGDPVWQPVGGMVDGAIRLDGVDDYIIASPALNSEDGSFSVLAWVKGGAPDQGVMSEPMSANWLTIDAEGKLMTELGGTALVVKPGIPGSTITDGNWHRIGVALDGSHVELYIDSVMVASDVQVDVGITASSLNIGVGKSYMPGSYWSGLIDDVRIYNRAVKP
jgi:lysophospholipase L1-like esterase